MSSFLIIWWQDIIANIGRIVYNLGISFIHSINNDLLNITRLSAKHWGYGRDQQQTDSQSL